MPEYIDGDYRVIDHGDGITERILVAPAAPPPVPMEVTIAQALTAAHEAGLLEGLLAWVAAQPVVRQLQFERILTVRRDSPLLLEGVTALGLSDAQVDALFIAADQVVI
jgi:hypothetical protein